MEGFHHRGMLLEPFFWSILLGWLEKKVLKLYATSTHLNIHRLVRRFSCLRTS